MEFLRGTETLSNDTLNESSNEPQSITKYQTMEEVMRLARQIARELGEDAFGTDMEENLVYSSVVDLWGKELHLFSSSSITTSNSSNTLHTNTNATSSTASLPSKTKTLSSEGGSMWYSKAADYWEVCNSNIYCLFVYLLNY